MILALALVLGVAAAFLFALSAFLQQHAARKTLGTASDAKSATAGAVAMADALDELADASSSSILVGHRTESRVRRG